jgi:TetR/AcrR family transcriptional regulator, regulator of cefoperazone and chloramphenicol sensitivity
LFETTVYRRSASDMSTDDTRTRVLEAAGSVFAERGFLHATIRDICRAAGVNLASVNYHFGDKQQLYAAAVQQAYQQTAQQVPLPDWPAGTPPEEKLAGFIRTMVTRMIGVSRAPWQSRLMMREVVQPTGACAQLVERYFRPHFELLLGILDELLPADTPEPRRHRIAFSVVGQCLFYRVAADIVAMIIEPDELQHHFTVPQLAEHIAQFTLAGLSAAGWHPESVEKAAIQASSPLTARRHSHDQ